MLPKFDFHVHTIYSDGESAAAAMIEAAEARGLMAAAITDHGPELSVGISPHKIIPMLQDIAAAREDAEIPVLAGIEANVVDADGTIDIDEKLIDRFDIIIMGIHKLRIFSHEPSELARAYFHAIMKAMEHRRVDVLAHPFQLHRYLAPYLLREDIAAFSELAAKKGLAIELNSKYRVPDQGLLEACLREGVKLSIGTDAHTVAEVGMVDWPMAMLRRVGASQEDLILDRFLR